ncbi:MAG: hypothetical protein HZA54_10090, partial [Planctomycetes bacterium]|nr:hypothetical protein [Planctomycetota bacterium]
SGSAPSGVPGAGAASAGGTAAAGEARAGVDPDAGAAAARAEQTATARVRLEAFRRQAEATARALAGRLSGGASAEHVLKTYAADAETLRAAAAAAESAALRELSLRSRRRKAAPKVREATARSALDQARLLERNGKIGFALRRYQDLSAAYGDTASGQAAGGEARRLQQDPELMSRIREECRVHTEAADALIAAGSKESALQLLERMLAECPVPTCRNRALGDRVRAAGIR